MQNTIKIILITIMLVIDLWFLKLVWFAYKYGNALDIFIFTCTACMLFSFISIIIATFGDDDA